MTALVRRATPDDLADLLVLVDEYCAADGHTFDEAIATDGLAPLLADDHLGVVWVLELDSSVDGYAAVTWGWSIEVGGYDVVLDELYVRSRGRGHGSELLRELEADCRRREVKRMFLETERPNDGARRLYERHGFVADDSIWMSKELT